MTSRKGEVGCPHHPRAMVCAFWSLRPKPRRQDGARAREFFRTCRSPSTLPHCLPALLTPPVPHSPLRLFCLPEHPPSLLLSPAETLPTGTRLPSQLIPRPLVPGALPHARSFPAGLGGAGRRGQQRHAGCPSARPGWASSPPRGAHLGSPAPPDPDTVFGGPCAGDVQKPGLPCEIPPGPSFVIFRLKIRSPGTPATAMVAAVQV